MSSLSTEDIAKDLGLGIRTVQKYIKDGFLPANFKWVKNHKVYEIDSDTYFGWKSKHFKGVKRGLISRYSRLTKELSRDELLNLIPEWLDWCRTGKLLGKPMSETTIGLYEMYLGRYFDLLPKHASKPLIAANHLRNGLGAISIESYSIKKNIFSAIMSFTKFLVDTGCLDGTARAELYKLKPRRFFPPKKTSINEEQINRLISEVDNISGNSHYDKLVTKTIVCFLVNTGLRASELCRLRLNDIDLENQTIYIHLGKGQKSRKVGINQEVYQAISEYLSVRSVYESEYFLLNGKLKPFTRIGLLQKVKRLAKRLDIDISLHGLRRTFASINSARGRPLNHLRMALGHADLSTTQSYIMTSENEVIEAMKGW